MKILIISTNFYPCMMGGAAKVAYLSAKYLAKRGLEIRVLTFGYEPVSIDGIKVDVIPPPKDSPELYGLSPRSFPFLFNPSRLWQLCKYIKKFDLVHMHNIHSYEFLIYLMIALKITRKPIVWTPHDYWFMCPNQSLLINDDVVCTEFDCSRDCLGSFSILKKISYNRRCLTKLLKSVDKVISPSNAMKEKLLWFGFEKEKVITIYNGIEVNKKEISVPLKNKLLFVGYVDKRKGTYYLVESIELVKKVLPSIKLVIVGTGPEIPSLKQLAKKLDIEDTVIFLGRVTNAKLEQEYRESHVVVLPSIWPENCSVVILEALAHGKPVITTNIGGNSELVEDGVSGFIVDPGNSHQIADKIVQILSDENLAKKLGENARKKAIEQFNIVAQVDKLTKIYRKLVRKKKVE